MSMSGKESVVNGSPDAARHVRDRINSEIPPVLVASLTACVTAKQASGLRIAGRHRGHGHGRIVSSVHRISTRFGADNLHMQQQWCIQSFKALQAVGL
jgi:hypothetical protein